MNEPPSSNEEATPRVATPSSLIQLNMSIPTVPSLIESISNSYSGQVDNDCASTISDLVVPDHTDPDRAEGVDELTASVMTSARRNEMDKNESDTLIKAKNRPTLSMKCLIRSISIIKGLDSSCLVI